MVRLPALRVQVQARLSGLKAPSAMRTLFGEADGVAFSSMPFVTTDHKGRQQVVMMQVPFTAPGPVAVGPELPSSGARQAAPSSLWALEDVGALQNRGIPRAATATPGAAAAAGAAADTKGTPLNRWRTCRQPQNMGAVFVGVGGRVCKDGRVGKDGGVDAAADGRAEGAVVGCCIGEGAAAPESMVGRVERSWYL
jgi:hypothetical protein